VIGVLVLVLIGWEEGCGGCVLRSVRGVRRVRWRRHAHPKHYAYAQAVDMVCRAQTEVQAL
jgi:hypothetical protein